MEERKCDRKSIIFLFRKNKNGKNLFLHPLTAGIPKDYSSGNEFL